MQLGAIPNNTAYLSDVTNLPTSAPTSGVDTPEPDLPGDIITPVPDGGFSWQYVSYCPKTYKMKGKTGKVLCRIMPNKTAKIWLDRLQYVIFVTSANYALITAQTEGVSVVTDRGESAVLNKDEIKRIVFTEYFDIINWKKGDAVPVLQVELGFNFDGEIPDTPTPAIDTPSPDIDTPSPDIDTPSPDIDTSSPDVDTSSPDNPTNRANLNVSPNYKVLQEDE